MHLGQCAFPLHGRKPRCKTTATEIVFVDPISFVKTCKSRKRPTEVWARDKLARQVAEERKRQQEHMRLVAQAQRECSKRLKKGDGLLGDHLLKKIDFYRFKSEELLAFMTGSLPKKRRYA